jgi:hypothetical protein
MHVLLEFCYILMENSQWENWNHLFCRKGSFLTAPHCRFWGLGQGMKQTNLYLWYILCQAQWDRCDQRNHQDPAKKFSETNIINMLELLIDNIFVIFGGRVFQQTVGIPMGTNCAPPLVWASFIQGLLKKKKITRSFIFTFRYIDDVLSLNNYRFGLLKNTSTKDNKYVVNQKFEHVDDISFRELFSRIRYMSLPSTRYSYLRNLFLFYETQLNQLP